MLLGHTNPAGRLPVTFYKEDEKLPAFDDYSMENRTYRYFTGEALYPFGYGLSYSQFKYSELKVNKKAVREQDEIRVSAKVTNTSDRAGDEVIQLYVQPLAANKGHSIKELRGFERIHLKAGETRTVEFALQPVKAMAHYNVAAKKYVVGKGKYQIQLGASSADVRLKHVVSVK